MVCVWVCHVCVFSFLLFILCSCLDSSLYSCAHYHSMVHSWLVGHVYHLHNPHTLHTHALRPPLPTSTPTCPTPHPLPQFGRHATSHLTATHTLPCTRLLQQARTYPYLPVLPHCYTTTAFLDACGQNLDGRLPYTRIRVLRTRTAGSRQPLRAALHTYLPTPHPLHTPRRTTTVVHEPDTPRGYPTP